MLQLEAHFPGKKANTAGIGLKGQLGSEPSCWHRPLAALGTGGTRGGGHRAVSCSGSWKRCHTIDAISGGT